MASDKLEQLRAELKKAEDDISNIGYTNGDIYDEDDGSYLGELDLRDEVNLQEAETLPAKLAVFFNGYFYIYQPVTRYKAEEPANGESEKQT